MTTRNPIDVQALVHAFHIRYGIPVADHPALPPTEQATLRAALLQEEADEFAAAARLGDLVGVADALADLVYIVYGTAITYGIDLAPVIAEVHRSNMTKQPGLTGGKPGKGSGYQPPRIAPVLLQQRVEATDRQQATTPTSGGAR